MQAISCPEELDDIAAMFGSLKQPVSYTRGHVPKPIPKYLYRILTFTADGVKDRGQDVTEVLSRLRVKSWKDKYVFSEHSRNVIFYTFENVLWHAHCKFRIETKLVVALMETEQFMDYVGHARVNWRPVKKGHYAAVNAYHLQGSRRLERVKVLERAEGQRWEDIRLANPEEFEDEADGWSKNGWWRVREN